MKFSHLITEEFNSSQLISGNKETCLDNVTLDQKKNIIKNPQIIFEIEEVPLEIENLNSPFNTPRGESKSKFILSRYDNY